MTTGVHRPVALITGATGGIGFHTAAALARAGMHVIVTGRDVQRGHTACTQLKGHAGHAAVDLIIADALLIRDNVSLAEEVARRAGHVDVLINNVGGAGFAERRETPEGLEATLALNFAGPFALTTRLLRILPRAPQRIVNVVSSAFQMWRRDPFEDLDGRSDYVALHAYGHAKLLNLLVTLALARRLAGSGASVVAVNPGMAWTPGVAGHDAADSSTLALCLARRAVGPATSICGVGREQRRASGDRLSAACVRRVLRRRAPQATAGGVARHGGAGPCVERR